MYKIIFLDIDGTILSSENTILAGTIQALKRVTDLNIPVILITARPPAAVSDIYHQLNLNTPVVCLNGALITGNPATANFEVLYSSVINATTAEKIKSLISGTDISLNFYQLGEWLTNERNKWITTEEQITGTTVLIRELNTYLEKWRLEKTGPQKILLIGEYRKIDSLEKQLTSLFDDQLNIYKSKPDYLEIMNRDASKISAIKFLIKKFELNREQVLAIGDNYNDIEMLRFAGMGIAMGNAPDAVKEAAQFVTLNNDSEGIQFALDKFIGA
jgi:Cof subfamily protein (haloacid dehalogenase superfamily)